MDYKGWYNRKELSFMKIEDVIILSAMGPPGGGRTFISNRVVRHFNVIAYEELSKAYVTEIFGSLVNSFLKKFNESIRTLIATLVESVIQFYIQVK